MSILINRFRWLVVVGLSQGPSWAAQGFPRPEKRHPRSSPHPRSERALEPGRWGLGGCHGISCQVFCSPSDSSTWQRDNHRWGFCPSPRLIMWLTILFNGITYIKWNMGLWKQHGTNQHVVILLCGTCTIQYTKKRVCLCLNLCNHQGIIQQWEHVTEFDGISLGKH